MSIRFLAASTLSLALVFTVTGTGGCSSDTDRYEQYCTRFVECGDLHPDVIEQCVELFETCSPTGAGQGTWEKRVDRCLEASSCLSFIECFEVPAC
jgi:hypothetical protein